MLKGIINFFCHCSFCNCMKFKRNNIFVCRFDSILLNFLDQKSRVQWTAGQSTHSKLLAYFPNKQVLMYRCSVLTMRVRLRKKDLRTSTLLIEKIIFLKIGLFSTVVRLHSWRKKKLRNLNDELNFLICHFFTGHKDALAISLLPILVQHNIP